MYQCIICKGQLIWQNDFDFEDYGVDGEGVVSVFQCSNMDCQTEIECYIPCIVDSVNN